MPRSWKAFALILYGLTLGWPKVQQLLNNTTSTYNIIHIKKIKQFHTNNHFFCKLASRLFLKWEARLASEDSFAPYSREERPLLERPVPTDEHAVRPRC